MNIETYMEQLPAKDREQLLDLIGIGQSEVSQLDTKVRAEEIDPSDKVELLS